MNPIYELTRFAERLQVDEQFCEVGGNSTGIIRLDKKGKLLGVVDGDEDGRYTVPVGPRRTIATIPSVLFDTLEYITGHCPGNEKRAAKRGQAFLEAHERLAEKHDLPELQAVVAFLKSNPKLESLGEDMDRKYLFQVGDKLLTGDYIREVIADDQNEKMGITEETYDCVISGRTTTVRTAPLALFKGPWKSNSKVFSTFNASSHVSHGTKWDERFLNAPMSGDVSQKHVAAMTELANRGQVLPSFGRSSTALVWWTDSEHPMESALNDILKGKEGARKDIESWVSSDVPIFLLFVDDGARIALRHHHRSTVGEIARNLMDFYGAVDKWSVGMWLPNLYRPNASTPALTPAESITCLKAILFGGRLPTRTASLCLSRMAQLMGDGFYDTNWEFQRTFHVCRIAFERAKMFTPEVQENLITNQQERMSQRMEASYLLGRYTVLYELRKGYALRDHNTPRDVRILSKAKKNPARFYVHLVEAGMPHSEKIRQKGWSMMVNRLMEEISKGIDPTTLPRRFTPQDEFLFLKGYQDQEATYWAEVKARKAARADKPIDDEGASANA